MGGLRRREISLRRYGPRLYGPGLTLQVLLTLLYLTDVWPRAGLAEEPAADNPVGAEISPAPNDTSPRVAASRPSDDPNSVEVNERGSAAGAAETTDPDSGEGHLQTTLTREELREQLDALGLQLDRAAAATHALDQLLPRQREIDRLITRARDDLNDGNYIRAVEQLQKVFSAPDDCFTRALDPGSSVAATLRHTLASQSSSSAESELKDSGSSAAASDISLTDGSRSTATSNETSDFTPTTARAAAATLLMDSSEALSLYRRTYDPAAEGLAAAAAAGDQAAMRTLMRQYSLTTPAAEFAIRRAALLIDSGQLERAGLLLNRLLSQRSLSADCVSRAQRLALVETRSNDSRSVAFANADLPLVRTAAVDESIVTGSRAEAAVLEPDASASGVGPVLAPLWASSHADTVQDDEEHVRVAGVIEHWQTEQLDHYSEAGPPGPQRPVVLGDRLIYRDFEGLVARELQTGRLLWSRSIDGSLVAALRQQDDSGERGTVERHLTIDSVGYELTGCKDSVYCVERMTSDSETPASRLVAVEASTGQVQWTHEARPNAPHSDADQEATSELGCFVLGPPTPTPDGLMLVVEVSGRLELRSLDPATGVALWSQSLALADIPGHRDRARTYLSCRPAFANGIVVCGTQLGTLVAVDASTGTLLWAERYADLTSGHGGRPRSVASRDFNPRAFVNPPVIFDGVVYALPIQSANVLAVSLETGNRLWSAPRENDRTIATIHPDRRALVLIGDRFVRSLDRFSGEEIWRTRIPAVTGSGVALGHELLLPVASRQMLRVNLNSGEVASDRWDRAAEPLERLGSVAAGNLIACGDYILRHGPTETTLLPRGSAVVQSASEALRSSDPSAVAAAHLAIARVQLASAKPHAALATLTRIVPATLADETGREFRHLLRETLFASLPQSEETPFDAEATFAQLDELAQTPDQMARVLNHKVRSELRRGELAEAVRIARRLASLNDGNQPGLLRRHQHNVDVQQLSGHLLASLSSEESEVLKLADRAAELSRKGADAGERAEFLTLFGRRPEAGRVRVATAEALLRSGKTQAAELQYLLAARDGDDESRVMSRLALAGLYARHDLPREAARQWEALLASSKDRNIGGGLTVGDLADQIQPDHPVGAAMRQRQPFPRPTYAASIRLETHEPDEWTSWYESMQQKMAPWPGATLDVIDAGRTSNDPPVSRLLIVDRETPEHRGSLEIPSYYFHPPSLIHRRVGHVLPIGFYEPFAVSLLEKRQLWSVDSIVHTNGDGADSETQRRSRRKVQVTVACPEACVLQQHNRLAAVEPITGKLLWSRTDLDRNSGVMFDQSSGVFGDEKRVTVFESDGIGYQIFDTLTGQRIERGRLEDRDVFVKRFRFTGSRRVLYLARSENQMVYRLWDAHWPHQPSPIAIPAGPTPLHYQLSDGRVGLVDAEGRFHLVDLELGHVAWRATLPEFASWDHVSKLRVFEQDGLCVVDIERAATSAYSQYALPEASVRVPKLDLGGELTAFQPDGNGSANVAWTKQVGRCSVLTGEEYRLPVLLLASRVRPEQGGYDQMMLRVLRVETGEELARHDELPRTPLWRWKYAIDDRRVELYGPEATITVRMGGIADVVKRAAEGANDVDALANVEPIFVSVGR